MRPNPQLNSDPACIAIRSLSTSCFLGSAHRLGAGGAGYLPSLGILRRFVSNGFASSSVHRLFDRPESYRLNAACPSAPQGNIHRL
jgi:hypothetical protein